MNLITVYRLSVVLPVVFVLAAFLYTVMAFDTFSKDWQDLLAWSGDGAYFSESGIFMLIALMALALINQVSMFFFWSPSRYVYAIICLLGFLITPFFGLLVVTPIESVLIDLSSFISGFCLGLCYFSQPIVDRFKSRPSVDEQF